MATHTHTPDTTTAATRPSMADAMLSHLAWNELHDLITLAQDALGEGPEDFSEMFMVNCEVQLAEAMKIIEARKNRYDWERLTKGRRLGALIDAIDEVEAEE